MTKTAIVTGASSGIGKAICETLLDMDYEVYGIGRDFSSCGNIVEHGSFHKIGFDLLATSEIEPMIRDIAKGRTINLLVNCAGVGYYGLHDEIRPENISELIRTNLEVPLLLSNILLKKLKESKGTILNIASVTATQSNPHGAAYGATKAGLLSFGKSLFDEVRKHGVKVTTILPDMTGRVNGRGAYVCKDPECFMNAVRKKGLERSLKCRVDAQVYEDLRSYFEGESS